MACSLHIRQMPPSLLLVRGGCLLHHVGITLEPCLTSAHGITASTMMMVQTGDNNLPVTASQHPSPGGEEGAAGVSSVSKSSDVHTKASSTAANIGQSSILSPSRMTV